MISGPYVHLIIHNDVMLWIWWPHNVSTSHILLTASGWRRGRRVYFLPILLQRLRCCALRGYSADLGCAWWLFQWPLTFDVNIFLSTQRLLTGDFLSYLNHSVQTLELVVLWWIKKTSTKNSKILWKIRPTWPTTVRFLLICNEKLSSSIFASGGLSFAAAANCASRQQATQYWVILIMWGPHWCAALIVFVIPVAVRIPLHYAISADVRLRHAEMLIKFFTVTKLHYGIIRPWHLRGSVHPVVNGKIRSSSFASSNQYTPPLFAVFHIDFHLIIIQLHFFSFFAAQTSLMYCTLGVCCADYYIVFDSNK